MTDRIRQRITTLEQQLREQTDRRDAAQQILSDANVAILHLQGALVVLKDLLVPEEAVPVEVAASDG